MKKILGIQKDHNASACLFYDNNLIYYNQEERLSKIKKDSGLPIKTLEEICTIDTDIDALLITGYDNFHTENLSIISIIQKIGFKLTQSFEFIPYYKSHHLFHAAKAFYSSNFDDALIIVRDGKGSSYNLNNGGTAYETTSVFSAKYPHDFNLIYKRLFTNSQIDCSTKIIKNNNFTIDKIEEPRFFNRNSQIELRNDFDLGFMYEGTSRSIGFDDDGGKMMGLQSYGGFDYSLPRIFDKNHIFNMNIFNFNDLNQHMGFNYNDFLILDSEKNKINFSFMIQKSFENAGLDLIKKMLIETGKKNLILTGGTALNVVANKVYRQNLDEDINLYIDPLCGDEGNCIGACQYYYYEKTKSKNVSEPISIYICGKTPEYNYSLKNNEIEIKDVNYFLISELLSAGHIVALFQNKAEAGPRALGNRSLLFDPRISNGKDIVNLIKKRESFRPFAASVMLEYANDWFDLEKINESSFMMYAVNVKDIKRDLIPSVVHVDGTCRIQTVTETQNQHLYNILKNFYNKTKIPLLLNTSFNLAGDPIVETIEDALSSLRKSQIEYLFLPDVNKLIYIKN